MDIIQIPVKDLIPYDNNPRHNGAAVPPVMASIQSFGFKVPIVIDKNNTIVTGHTRLLAAKELGLETVPCIIANDLTEDQVRAFRLADNKVSEQSSWDWEKLEEELSLMEIADIDMKDFGFDEAFPDAGSVDDLFNPHAPEEKEEKKKTMKCPHCGEEFEV